MNIENVALYCSQPLNVRSQKLDTRIYSYVNVLYTIDLMHDDVLLINSPSLTFKMQMRSQRTGIEKNTSMKYGKSVQKLHGSEAWH